MKNLLVIVFLILGSTGFAQKQTLNFSVAGGANFTKGFFGDVQNSDYTGLDQWGKIGMGWSISPLVSYYVFEDFGIYSGLRLTQFHYIQNQESFFRTGNEIDTGEKTFIKQNIRYYSFGIPIGIYKALGERFILDVALIYYYSGDSKVEGIFFEGGIDGGVRFGQGENNAIVKNNIAAEIGLFFFPKRMFSKENKNIFLGMSIGHTFKPDVVYFSDSEVLKLTATVWVGIKL